MLFACQALAPGVLKQLVLAVLQPGHQRGGALARILQLLHPAHRPIQTLAQGRGRIIRMQQTQWRRRMVHPLGQAARAVTLGLLQHLHGVALVQGLAQPFLKRAQLIAQEGAAQIVAGQGAALIFEQLDGGLVGRLSARRLPPGRSGQALAGEAAHLNAELLLCTCTGPRGIKHFPRLCHLAQGQQRLAAQHLRARRAVGLGGTGKALGRGIGPSQGLHRLTALQGQLAAQQRHAGLPDPMV